MRWDDARRRCPGGLAGGGVVRGPARAPHPHGCGSRTEVAKILGVLRTTLVTLVWADANVSRLKSLAAAGPRRRGSPGSWCSAFGIQRGPDTSTGLRRRWSTGTMQVGCRITPYSSIFKRRPGQPAHLSLLGGRHETKLPRCPCPPGGSDACPWASCGLGRPALRHQGGLPDRGRSPLVSQAPPPSSAGTHVTRFGLRSAV